MAQSGQGRPASSGAPPAQHACAQQATQGGGGSPASSGPSPAQEAVRGAGARRRWPASGGASLAREAACAQEAGAVQPWEESRLDRADKEVLVGLGHIPVADPYQVTYSIFPKLNKNRILG